MKDELSCTINRVPPAKCQSESLIDFVVGCDCAILAIPPRVKLRDREWSPAIHRAYTHYHGTHAVSRNADTYRRSPCPSMDVTSASHSQHMQQSGISVCTPEPTDMELCSDFWYRAYLQHATTRLECYNAAVIQGLYVRLWDSKNILNVMSTWRMESTGHRSCELGNKADDGLLPLY